MYAYFMQQFLKHLSLLPTVVSCLAKRQGGERNIFLLCDLFPLLQQPALIVYCIWPLTSFVINVSKSWLELVPVGPLPIIIWHPLVLPTLQKCMFHKTFEAQNEFVFFLSFSSLSFLVAIQIPLSISPKKSIFYILYCTILQSKHCYSSRHKKSQS